MESIIKDLVSEVKKEMFSSASATVDLCSFVSPCAYDTAWVAMIPDPDRPEQPLFRQCLEWIMDGGQGEGGWWGEVGTIECLTASLACMVALKTWDVGPCNVEKGLAFIRANAEKLLCSEEEGGGAFPRWFCIVFPAMVDLAQSKGLNVFPDGLTDAVVSIYSQRQRIFEMEECMGEAYGHQYQPPLLAYLEALPPSHALACDKTTILQNQCKDGSLFQSPSATAHAFMLTGDERFRLCLESMVQRSSHGGVSPLYPIDEELMKLIMVDRLEKLGLSEHFSEEIEHVLHHVYKNWIIEETEEDRSESCLVPLCLYKDSLAFRLLRMHGFRVSPGRFCWFLQHEDVTSYVEENYDSLLSALLSVYRATQLMFLGEKELEDARSFSKALLQRGLTMKITKDSIVEYNVQNEIKHELQLPWLARMDHLEHRVGIEKSESNDYLWMGKASYCRLSFLNNEKLQRLAKENYNDRQSIFKKELEEVKRWSRDFGLQDIGFGREKTVYCYYSIASTAYHRTLSEVRQLTCRSAILVTVADDFYDMEGSLDELNTLTEAVARWDGEGLTGHGKVIFDALSNLVDHTIKILFDRHQVDGTQRVKSLWYEAFESWLKEAEWSRRGCAPSIDEYIETGMTSIAVHTMILPACYLTSSESLVHQMRHSNADVITRLLMVSTRLLNDMQSFEKEKEDGKWNLVLLYLKENPELDMEDSIDCIRKIVDDKKKEFLKMVLENGITGLPESYRYLHLCCLKAFQMFFNSSNGFDSPTALIGSIHKAIYEPLKIETHSSQPLHPHQQLKKINPIARAQIGTSFHDYGGKRFPFYPKNIEPNKIRVVTDHVFPLRSPIVHHSLMSHAKILMPSAVAKPLFW